MAKKTMTLPMHSDKATIGSVRYTDNAKPGVHTFYLGKSEMKKPYPNEITVTIVYEIDGEKEVKPC